MKLKYQVTRDPYRASETHLQGYVRIPVSTLIDHFGAPEYLNEETTAHWIIDFDDGTVATVHIHKPVEYGLAPCSVPLTVYRWHVGGKSHAAVFYVAHVLGVPPIIYRVPESDEDFADFCEEILGG